MEDRSVPSIRVLCAALLVALLWLAPLAHSENNLEVGTSEQAAYGAHVGTDGWVHFAVYAPAAEGVSLLLYDAPDAVTPRHTIPMQRAGSDWRVKVKGPGVGAGLVYMYEASGPNDVSTDDRYGAMFNPNYPLNDPYAYATEDVRYGTFFASTPFAAWFKNRAFG
jgi:pullulanase/glycogen debranching enzyme